MRSVSATEAKQSLAALLDLSQREPVLIRRHDRDISVLVSAAEYEEFRRLKADELDRFCAQVGARAKALGMNEKVLARLLAEDRPAVSDAE